MNSLIQWYRFRKLNHPTGSINQGSNSGQPFILPTTSSLSQPIIRAEPPPIVLNGEGLIVEQTADGEWTYDPNEPRYCICNQVSYGDMVACDNEAVSVMKTVQNQREHSLLSVNVLVSLRMVPLSLCGYNTVTERKVVLPEMHSINETSGHKKIGLVETAISSLRFNREFLRI